MDDCANVQKRNWPMTLGIEAGDAFCKGKDDEAQHDLRANAVTLSLQTLEPLAEKRVYESVVSPYLKGFMVFLL